MKAYVAFAVLLLLAVSNRADLSVSPSTTAIVPGTVNAVQVAPTANVSIGELHVILKDAHGKPYGTRVPGSVPGWRFAGGATWYSSGDTVDGLTAGDFPLEFESIVDFVATPPSFVPAHEPSMATVTAGNPTTATFVYPPITSAKTGSLTVILAPAAVTAGNLSLQDTAQWHFLGGNGWRNSGDTVSGLPIGSYLLQFKTVPGYEPIPDQSVQIKPDAAEVSVYVNYPVEASVVGALPAPVSFTEVTTASPYDFVGQLSSVIGHGSGVVVGERVVLTAAHVVFDDNTLTFATGVRWQFERCAGQLEPAPLTPVGSYILDGYAASRRGATPDVGTPASEELDTAAVYFATDAGNGGSSGYLVSTNADEWLLTAQSAVLVGYPEDTGQPNNTVVPGQMQATAAQDVSFSLVNAQQPNVYATTDITGLAGMSGGPLCVQYSDNLYYPAGIYLGGNQQCLVRAIDPAVHGLIQHAKLSSEGGANHVAGGDVVVDAISGAGGTFSVGSVQVNFGAGAPTGAAWRFSTEATNVAHSGGMPVGNLPAGVSLTLVFAPIAGYSTPPDYGPFKLTAGENLVLGANYGPLTPVITTQALPIGGAGLAYSTRIVAANGPTSFTGMLTDPSGATSTVSTTPSSNPLNLTLNGAGTLQTGPKLSLPSAAVGTYELAVRATNGAPGAGTATLELVVAPTGTFSVAFNATEGNVKLGTTTLTSNQTPLTLIQGETITLTATAKSPQFLFEGWTGSGTPSVSSSAPFAESTLQFTMTPSVQLTAGFEANPYLTLAGTYHGLIIGDADALPARGFLTAEVTALGACTLTAYVGAQRYSAVTAFVLNDAVSQVATLSHAFSSSVSINLQLDLTGNTQAITGAVTVNGAALALTANEAVFGGAVVAPQALGQKTYARYTMGLPHSTGTGLPQGDGYGTVTVTPTGAVRFVGTLGDGTAVSEGTSLGSAGQWPFFVLLYGNAGVVTGPLAIVATGATTGTVSGSLDWLKPASKAQFYPAGFTIGAGEGNAIAVEGLALGTTPLAGLTQATLTITGGGLSPSVPSIMAAISSKGAGSATGVKGFAFSIVPTTGLFSGRFLDEAAVSHNFNGVLLPADGGTAQGFGLFKGAPSTGTIGSPPGETGAVEF